MRTDKKRFSTRLMAALMAGTLAAGMMGMGVCAEETTTPTNVSEVSITKKVTTDGDTYAPNTSFKFTVSPAGEGTYRNDKVNKGVTGGLYFTQNKDEKVYTGSITFAPSGTTPSDAGYEGTTKLKADASAFPATGIYHYTLSETDSGYSGITYDTTARDVYVYVYEKDNARYVGSIQMVKQDTQGKEKNEAFVNDYGEKNNTTHDITVKKSVAGNMGEHDKKFKFKVSVNGDAGEWYKVLVKEKEGSTAVESHIVSGADAVEYSIKDTGSIQIFGLTSNDTYTVEEDDYSGDGYVTTVDSTTTRTVTGNVQEDGASKTVTNTKNTSSPTGVILNYGPYILMIVLAGSLATFFLFRRNRKQV